MPHIDHNGNALYYEVYGEGPAVVLLHGVGGNHLSWFNQVVAWRDRFQVILIDARGFGKSIDATCAGRTAFTADLTRMLDVLGIARAAIVGQSMGGGTAIDFCVNHPERVSALVIADSLVGIALPEPLASRMRTVAEKTAGLSQVQRVLGSTYRADYPAQTLLYLQIAGINRYDVRTLVGEQPSHSPDELSSTGIRTAFVVGEEDVLFPPNWLLPPVS
ncbi:alpha/beta fold hydrolase [Cupriavidus basilensis]